MPSISHLPGRCHERLRGTMCSLAAEPPHDIHVTVEHGLIVARWRMVAEELPLHPTVITTKPL